MIKKTIQSFAFFAFFQVLVFSCCDDAYHVYYEGIEILANDISDDDTTTVSSENLILRFNPIYEYVLTSNFKELQRLSNTANATTCDSEYYYIESITSIEVTANVDILGIPSGNAINEKLSYKNPETLENEPFDVIIGVLNSQNNYDYNSFDILLNERIATHTEVSFTIKIHIEENDRTLTASTEILTIE